MEIEEVMNRPAVPKYEGKRYFFNEPFSLDMLNYGAKSNQAILTVSPVTESQASAWLDVAQFALIGPRSDELLPKNAYVVLDPAIVKLRAGDEFVTRTEVKQPAGAKPRKTAEGTVKWLFVTVR